MRGLTFEEILQSKVDEERRRKMAMKDCEFPKCEKKFYTQGDENRRYCTEHNTKEGRVSADPPAAAEPAPDPAPAKKPAKKKASKKRAPAKKKAHRKPAAVEPPAPAPLVQEMPIAPVPANGKVTVSDLEEVMTEFTNGEEDQYPFAAMVWGYLRGRGVAA